MVEKFNSDGYIVLENVIDKEMLNKINSLSLFYIKRTLERQEYSGNILYNLFRTENLIYDFPIPELLNNELIYSFIKSILGSDFILKEILVFFSEPKNHLQGLHSDQEIFFDKDTKLPTSIISVQIPLMDFNFLNGGTRIVKGTHNKNIDILSLEEKIKNDKSFTPEVKKQSCLIRDVRTLHGAGVNNSNDRRAMLVLVYTKKWIGCRKKVSKDFYFNIEKTKRHVVKI